MPVIAGNMNFCYFHLQIITEDVSELQKKNTIKRIIATLMVFSLGIALSIFLAIRYTEPIHHVVEAARKVADGDLNQNLPEGRKDEIGDLTRSFNFMVQRLREERRLEERLREAEHLSAVGQLSRTIAHEIRNPLNYISLSIDHIKEKYRPAGGDISGNFDALISRIKHEIHRLDKLVSDFLDYGKPLKMNVQKISVFSVLNDVIQIVKPKAGSDKVAIVERFDFLPELEMDLELMKTCIFNIVINGLQAMPNGGTLTMGTEGKDGHFVLKVGDTGSGISKENISRVFEPFFTTKLNGLGLGLAITKRVIEEHGGKIEFSSVEGRGSEITINLPVPSPLM
jgi:nitrogen fixation/metabolism regulation signal transduction histidine kinase